MLLPTYIPLYFKAFYFAPPFGIRHYKTKRNEHPTCTSRFHILHYKIFTAISIPSLSMVLSINIHNTAYSYNIRYPSRYQTQHGSS